MMNVVISFLIGILPESIFLTITMIQIKDLKERRWILWIAMFIVYLFISWISFYQIYSYVFLILLNYCVLKIIYPTKTQWIDIFGIGILELYLTIISIICFAPVSKHMEYYLVAFVLNRIGLLLPICFGKTWRKFYQRYYSLWNVNKQEKLLIKSLTLRIISIILLCGLIIILNLAAIYIKTII